MKKLTKISALILALITVFSTVSFAAEDIVTEIMTTVEATNASAKEEVTTSEEETTTSADETTTSAEETTAGSQEEITTEIQQETTNPEEEATTTTEETTTTPEEESTTAQPEVVLPKTPTGLEISSSNLSNCSLSWDYDKDAQGYDVFSRVDGEWVYCLTTPNALCTISDLLCYSEYEFGVRSFVIADDVKYYSEDIATITYNAPDEVPDVTLYIKHRYAGGIVFSWSNIHKSISGYILYRRSGNKWERIATIRDREISEFEYKFPDMKTGKEYKFAIKTYVKGTKGTKYSALETKTVKFDEIGKTYIEATGQTASSITLEWEKVEGATGYRLYKYNSAKKKYETVKTTSKLSYTVKGLEASTKYRFRVRAYYKADGKTMWCTYSDSIPAYTGSKSVKASYVSKYKKYFTDGDWSVKLKGLYDTEVGNFDYTLAVRGNKIFVRYDFKNKSLRDFEYLIDADKEKAYIIFDSDKTYAVLNDEDAYTVVYSALMMGMLLDMSEAKGVKAKTLNYGKGVAIQEYYTEKETGLKKVYTFYEGKPVALEIIYEDGSSESMTISKINDTPSSSVFKLPSGYKKIAY